MNDKNNPESAQEPPCSNRGVKNLRRAVNLDWISGSFPLKHMRDTESVHLTFCYILGIKNPIIEVIKPRQGFMSAVKCQIGRFDIKDDAHSSYAGFVLTGKELAEYRTAGGEIEQLIKRLIDIDGRTSRLDIAIDIFNDDRASVTDLEQAYRSGNIKTRAKTSRLIEDMETHGKTLYIGSRHSETFFRGYDKAIESGNLDELWLRMELEIKEKSAVRLSQQISKIGLVDSARYWFEKYRFEALWYKEMLKEMKYIEPPQLEKKPTKARWWLENQVLPALRKLAENEPDTLAWFMETLGGEFGNL